MPELIEARYRIARGDFTLDVDLSLPGRGVSALFGPSGAGKSSILRAIAGLERPAACRLLVAGECWDDGARGVHRPSHQRALGYVFQDARLFEHLRVGENLDYGRRRSATPLDARELADLVELLGIAGLVGRWPRELSGGERQRVAIARALARRPRLLLLDEPLASLDQARRREILPYLERLQGELAIPVIYVSHALDEVLRLADHLVLLEGGSVVASGPLGATLARLDLPIARGPDAGVLIEGDVVGHDPDYHLSQLAFDGGVLTLAEPEVPRGQRVRVQVLARDVSLSRAAHGDSTIVNVLEARIVDTADAGTPAHLLVRLEVGATPLLARITRRSWDQLGLAVGEPILAQVKAVAVLG